VPLVDSRPPLRLVFLGCGAIARTHARTLRRFPSVRIGFASRDPRRARAYADRFEGVAAFPGYDAAIGSSDVDGVIVTTPPPEHFGLTMRALLAGKHVLVEKPAFRSSREADLVLATSHEVGRQVLVLENYGYKPLTAVLRRLLADDAVGTVRLIRINALKHQADWGWRTDPALAGGGALFEGGIHWLHFMATIGPEIESVSGFAPPSPGGLERSMLVVTRHHGGAIGTLHHAWDAPVRWKGLALSQVIGTRGTIVFESNGLVVGLNDRRGRRLFFPGFRDIRGYRAMFTDLIAALRDGRPPRVDLLQARRDLWLAEEAYRTAGVGSIEAGEACSTAG